MDGVFLLPFGSIPPKVTLRSGALSVMYAQLSELSEVGNPLARTKKESGIFKIISKLEGNCTEEWWGFSG